MASTRTVPKTSLFRNNISDMAFFADAARDELLKKLAHLIEFTRLTLFISGEPGTGKTSLLKQRFIKTRKPNWRVAIVDAHFCRSAEQLLRQLQQAWQLDNITSAEQLLGAIDALRQGGAIPLLVVDNSDQMAGEVLQFITRLRQASGGELRVVLFGRQLSPEVNQALDPGDDEDQALIMLSLEPLSEADTAEYVHHILRHMKQDAKPFTGKVLREIYQHSKGYIPRINNQANRILRQGGNNGERPRPQAGGFKLIILALLISIAGFLLFGPQQTPQEQDEDDAQRIQTLTLPPESNTDAATKTPPTRAAVSIRPPEPVRAPAKDSEVPATAPSERPPAAQAAPREAKQARTTEPAPSPAPAKPPAARSKPAPPPAAEARPAGIKDAAWLARQDPKAFTLQLVASGREANILAFIARHKLGDKAAYFRTQRKGRPWYSLVYGLYPSRAEATAAIRKLPAELQKLKPWIRSLGEIQKNL